MKSIDRLDIAPEHHGKEALDNDQGSQGGDQDGQGRCKDASQGSISEDLDGHPCHGRDKNRTDGGKEQGNAEIGG